MGGRWESRGEMRRLDTAIEERNVSSGSMGMKFSTACSRVVTWLFMSLISSCALCKYSLVAAEYISYLASFLFV